jgi:hypothetical protein
LQAESSFQGRVCQSDESFDFFENQPRIERILMDSIRGWILVDRSRGGFVEPCRIDGDIRLQLTEIEVGLTIRPG